MPLKIETMRTIFMTLLITLATQVGAEQLTTTVSALLSDAQVKLENKSLLGELMVCLSQPNTCFLQIGFLGMSM